MMETKIEIIWNGNKPVQEMQDTLEIIRAILDNRVKNNTLTYTVKTPNPSLDRWKSG